LPSTARVAWKNSAGLTSAPDLILSVPITACRRFAWKSITAPPRYAGETTRIDSGNENSSGTFAVLIEIWLSTNDVSVGNTTIPIRVGLADLFAVDKYTHAFDVVHLDDSEGVGDRAPHRKRTADPGDAAGG